MKNLHIETIRNNPAISPGKRMHLRLARAYLSDLTDGGRNYRLFMGLVHCVLGIFSRNKL